MAQIWLSSGMESGVISDCVPTSAWEFCWRPENHRPQKSPITISWSWPALKSRSGSELRMNLFQSTPILRKWAIIWPAAFLNPSLFFVLRPNSPQTTPDRIVEGSGRDDPNAVGSCFHVSWHQLKCCEYLNPSSCPSVFYRKETTDPNREQTHF